jgi:hypothetical protein
MPPLRPADLTSYKSHGVDFLFEFPDKVTAAYQEGDDLFYKFALLRLYQSAHCGTGGNPSIIEPTFHSLTSASGAYFCDSEVLSSWHAGVSIRETTEATSAEAREQLVFIRHYLSLNPTDLSRVLFVERPTVYAWLDGKWEPKQENRGRIRRLHQLARAWWDKSKQPIGKSLREPLDGELSLMEYLVRDPLEMGAINRILSVIQEQADRRMRSKKARSVHTLAEQSGFKPLSRDLEKEHFDQTTRF